MPQSVILIPVPSADPIVGEWRKKYDEVALHGIPSHVSLLFPFKESSKITLEIIQKLNAIFAEVKQFSFVLEKICTFPSVIYLEPQPREKFITLTENIVRVFPENPPYEGKYPQINPHMTIAQLSDIQNIYVTKEEIARDIVRALPIKALAEDMDEFDGEWSIKMKFCFTT